MEYILFFCSAKTLLLYHFKYVSLIKFYDICLSTSVRAGGISKYLWSGLYFVFFAGHFWDQVENFNTYPGPGDIPEFDLR